MLCFWKGMSKTAHHGACAVADDDDLATAAILTIPAKQHAVTPLEDACLGRGAPASVDIEGAAAPPVLTRTVSVDASGACVGVIAPSLSTLLSRRHKRHLYRQR